MKSSQFNFLFRVDDQAVLAYNSLTTALAKLTPQELSVFQEFCSDPRDDLFESAELTVFRDDLVKAGFLLPDGEDEHEQIRTLHTALKHQRQRIIGLTIVPTLDCNFRCAYCFSYAKQERMSSEVQDALVRFVERKLPETEGLSVTWYGGEPTLCLNIIDSLSARFQNLCEKHGARYLPSDIVTNGYLLTEKVAHRLKQAGVTQAQITLDGGKDTHDKRRPLLGGHSTFKRILDNVAASRSILDIQVRINIDRSNARTAVEALDALAEHGLQGLPAYFGHVQPFSEACVGIASDCFSNQEFGELNLELTRQAIARGFSSLRYPRLQVGGICGADHENGYLVAPDGLLFKCWAQASLGPEKSIGTVFDTESNPLQKENLRRFLDWDPQADQGCRDCRILPICMGGCPYLRLAGADGANCAPWRNFLLDTLALRYKLGCLAQEQTLKIEE